MQCQLGERILVSFVNKTDSMSVEEMKAKTWAYADAGNDKLIFKLHLSVQHSDGDSNIQCNTGIFLLYSS